ncbi:trypsin-like serine protease [Nocardia puris]|uniref:Trypsin n=1 Tax=Nocardia puris TaxID=208602 RepID=A0A366CZE7_9NOCA|nr:S1 family peptidase [Nocardia puris]MBF6211639.1 trypsin-like serine protease [Nocardia puris]MBF6365642.1 trypsin-like serine protease [Nocardia puris]MBF6460715.1 trypsin-like serine protease [Nocardia puris]RBO83035.1 trypsin [Nocardia puris]
MLLPDMRRSPSSPGRTRAFVRRAAVAAAAVLIAGPLAASAHAEPAGPQLPEELAAAVQRDLKISPQEYVDRAGVAQQVAAFATDAQAKFPQVFAGAWLNEAGQGVIALAKGEGADAAREAAQEAGFTVNEVAKSESALREEISAFSQWLDGQPEWVSKLVRGAVIDTVNNAIAVRVDQAGLPLPTFIDPARVIVSAPPVTGQPIAEPREIAEAGTGALVAGQAYAAVSGDVFMRCSLGFNGTDGAGNVVNITAGHCNPEVPGAAGVFEVFPGDEIGQQLGTFHKSVLGAQDYAIVRVNNQSRPRFENNLVGVPGRAPIALTGTAVPVVGAPVCKSGTTTGFSCGVINAVDQTVLVGEREQTQTFSANICGLRGDSGGPVITGTLALGIASASSVADDPFCEFSNFLGLLTGNAPQLFAQPLHTVLADNPGLSVRTN